MYQLSHETNLGAPTKHEANLYKTFEIKQKQKEDEAAVEVQRVRQYIDLMRSLSGTQFVPVVVEDAKE